MAKILVVCVFVVGLVISSVSPASAQDHRRRGGYDHSRHGSWNICSPSHIEWDVHRRIDNFRRCNPNRPELWAHYYPGYELNRRHVHGAPGGYVWYYDDYPVLDYDGQILHGDSHWEKDAAIVGLCALGGAMIGGGKIAAAFGALCGAGVVAGHHSDDRRQSPRSDPRYDPRYNPQPSPPVSRFEGQDQVPPRVVTRSQMVPLVNTTGLTIFVWDEVKEIEPGKPSPQSVVVVGSGQTVDVPLPLPRKDDGKIGRYVGTAWATTADGSVKIEEVHVTGDGARYVAYLKSKSSTSDGGASQQAAPAPR